MDPALRGHVTGDGEQTIGQIHTRGEHGRFVFLLMGLMPTAGRLICNQIVWVRFPQCPRWATRWLRVKKMNNVPVMTNGIVWNSNNVRVTKRDLIRKETYRHIGCESPRLNLLRL